MSQTRTDGEDGGWDNEVDAERLGLKGDGAHCSSESKLKLAVFRLQWYLKLQLCRNVSLHGSLRVLTRNLIVLLQAPHSHSRSASPRRHAITTGFVELHSMRIQFCHSCTILLQWLSGLYALRGRNASRKGPCMAVLVYLLCMKYLNINC